MPSDLIFPEGGGHQAGPGGWAVPTQPALSRAQAAPGSYMKVCWLPPATRL